VVLILALSTLVGAAAGPVDIVLLMTGRSTWSMWNTAVSLGINIGLNFLLIPRLGIIGAAVAWAVARVVGNVLPLIQVSRSSGFHPFGRELGYAVTGSLIAFGALAWIVRIALGPSTVGLAVACAVGLAAYAWFLFRYRRQLALPAALGNFRPDTES
jgi:O-antigen/teichoic acid export membrane protein